jgi:hypothetical protein
VARAVWGCLLLTATSRVERAVPGSKVDRTTVTFGRFLGARQLAHAVLIGRRATAGRVLVGAGVDALHAATMTALAVACPGQRRLASANAVTAALLAAAGALDAYVIATERDPITRIDDSKPQRDATHFVGTAVRCQRDLASLRRELGDGRSEPH